MKRIILDDLGWLAHDCLVHPITGAIGFIGRIVKSPRIVALSMHAHNASAPSNDVWADLSEAAARSTHNETYGRTTVPCKVCLTEPGTARDNGLYVPTRELPDYKGEVWADHELRPGQPCPMSGRRTNLSEEEQLAIAAPGRRKAEMQQFLTEGPVLEAIVAAVLAELARRGLK